MISFPIRMGYLNTITKRLGKAFFLRFLFKYGKNPPKNDFMAHIFVTVWAIYWQDIGHTAHLAQYMALAPKPNIGHTVSHIMSTFVPYFVYQSVGHIISIMWENYGPYSAEAPEQHMAHILPTHCPQIFFYAGKNKIVLVR